MLETKILLKKIEQWDNNYCVMHEEARVNFAILIVKEIQDALEDLDLTKEIDTEERDLHYNSFQSLKEDLKDKLRKISK